MKTAPKNRYFFTGPAALSAMWSVVLLTGMLGCQGCKSGADSDSIDVGDPDRVISSGESGKNGAQPLNGGVPVPGPGPAAAPDEALGVKARKLEAAIEYVEEQLTLAQRELGVSVLMGGNANAITKILDKFLGMLSAGPSDPRLLYLAGHATMLAGDFKKAREYFGKCVAEADWFLPAWKGIALSWAAEKDLEKASEAASRLKDSTDLGPFGLILLAEVLVETGKDKEAEALLAKSLEEHPASIYPLLALAEFYRRHRRWEEAFDKMDKAVRRAPNNQKVWFSKAESHGVMVGDAMKRIKSDPRAREDYQTHYDLLLDSLDRCRQIDPNSFRGIEAGKAIERIKRPEQEYMKIVLDQAEPIEIRLKFLAMLSSRMEECGIEFWKAVLALPERELRMGAIKCLGRWPTADAISALTGVLCSASNFERSEAVQALILIIKINPAEGRKSAIAAVNGLLGCMETTIKNFESGKEDADVVDPLFQDLLESLGKYTGGMRFGEGDISTLDGKKATLAKWREWVAKQDPGKPADQPGKPGEGGPGSPGGAGEGK